MDSLSYDTVKFKVEKVDCSPTGCIINLRPKFKEVPVPFKPSGHGEPFIPHFRTDATFAIGIICFDVVNEFDVRFLEDEIVGKKVRIKGLKRKLKSTYDVHNFLIFVRSPEDIEVID